MHAFLSAYPLTYVRMPFDTIVQSLLSTVLLIALRILFAPLWPAWRLTRFLFDNCINNDSPSSSETPSKMAANADNYPWFGELDSANDASERIALLDRRRQELLSNHDFIDADDVPEGIVEEWICLVFTRNQVYEAAIDEVTYRRGFFFTFWKADFFNVGKRKGFHRRSASARECTAQVA